MSDWEIIEVARKLTPTERFVLLSLRDDGTGTYDRRLTRSRTTLHKKGLATAQAQIGFAKRYYAVLQQPTELGARLQRYLQGEA